MHVYNRQKYHKTAVNMFRSKKQWVGRLMRNIRHYRNCGFHVAMGGDVNAAYPEQCFILGLANSGIPEFSEAV